MIRKGRGIGCMWYPMGFTVAASPSAATVNVNEEVGYSITGIGTTQMMTIELEVELRFANDVGPDTVGIITAQVRLRVPES